MKTTRKFVKFVPGLLCMGMLIASQAMAAPNAGFGEIGFIQRATLNAAPRGANTPEHRGGSIVVNGIRMIVPDNTVIQFPANTMTWADMFDPAVFAPVYGADVSPLPINPPLPPAGRTGLALNDPITNHFPAYEVSVVGNIITDFTTGTQRYIVGLIAPAAQIDLHNHGGYINYIDYPSGRFRVGGTIGDVNCDPAQAYGGPTCSGTLVEINDPVGRWGKIHSPDQRFSTDTANPTVTAATGYPMCIPRVNDPVAEDDPDCPKANRPINVVSGLPEKIFTFPAVGGPGDGTSPDPYRMVPLAVGDWVDVGGTIFKIDPNLGNGPRNQYISAHTVAAHLGMRTAPGTVPAYIQTEEFLFGVGDRNGGPTVGGIAQETSTRAVLVAFTTDPTGFPIDTPGAASLFGVYYAPDGSVQEIPFPNNDPGTPFITIDDNVRGRIRWATSNNGSTPGVLGNAAGPQQFYREYILRLFSGATQLPTQHPVQPDGSVGDLPGLIAGEYLAPIFEYIFGEGTNFGEPIPPFNFNDLGFLSIGEGAAGPGGATGPLRPFPAFQ